MDVEQLAAAEVTRVLSRTDYIKPFINVNDKIPARDGEVHVYQIPADNHKKEYIPKKIPVQVKGHRTKSIHPDTVSFRTDVADLDTYLNDGGCMYFVVYFDDNGENGTIYYKGLLPYDLRKILKSCEGQKTKTLTFRRFPTKKDEIVNVFLNFVRDKQKQLAYISSDVNGINDVIDGDQVPEISFETAYIDDGKQTPFASMFITGVYLYVPAGHNIYFPIAHIENIKSIKIIEKKPHIIMIGNKIYYKDYEICEKKNSVYEIKIGKSFIFINDFKNNMSRFSFTLAGMLSERITDLKFLLDAFDYGGFILGDEYVNFANAEETDLIKFDRDAAKKHLEALCVIKSVLNKMHVKVDLNMDIMTKQDNSNLDSIVGAVISKTPVFLDNYKKSIGFLNIANLNLLVTAAPDKSSNTYTMTDFFDNNQKIRVTYKQDNTELECPLSVILSKDALLKCDNICPSVIVSQIRKAEYSEFTAGKIISFLLQVLLAYDTDGSDKELFIDLATKIIREIKKKDTYTPKEIIRINELQIIKRKRPLKSKEINDLKIMAEENKDNDEIATGAYLLLDNQDEAERHYSNMPVETQEIFKTYPIFKFWNENKED